MSFYPNPEAIASAILRPMPDIETVGRRLLQGGRRLKAVGKVMAAREQLELEGGSQVDVFAFDIVAAGQLMEMIAEDPAMLQAIHQGIARRREQEKARVLAAQDQKGYA